MDYPELIAEVTERSGDSTVATRASMYLRMAEAAIDKALRIGDSESIEVLTTDASGEATLPSDFSMIRMVQIGVREAEAIDFPTATLTPFVLPRPIYGYAIRGNKIVTTTPNTDVTLYYYAKIQPLDLTGTNWLIESDPEIYLYAMLKQVFMARLDAEKAAAAEAMFNSLTAEKRSADAIVRFGRKPFRAAGAL